MQQEKLYNLQINKPGESYLIKGITRSDVIEIINGTKNITECKTVEILILDHVETIEKIVY